MMSEKRFIVQFNKDNFIRMFDNMKNEVVTEIKAVDLLNQLNDENRELRQQLECNKIGKSICSVCTYHYLELSRVFYVSRCEKGHDECSKTTVKYCEDFEVKGEEDE